MLTLAGERKAMCTILCYLCCFSFQTALRAELVKETAKFQKKFLQEAVSETMNFQRDLSWRIMTCHGLYPNIVRSHCGWIFTAAPKRKKMRVIEISTFAHVFNIGRR